LIYLLDNYDSFSYNLYDILTRHGLACRVVKNDELNVNQWLALSDIDLLLISPGPGRPEQAGHLMDVILSLKLRVPMLGICLGMQAIGLAFGASLVHAIRPMHGKVSKMKHHGHFLFEGIPSEFEMMRYHSLVLHELPKDLCSISESAEGECMAITHVSLPIWAVQFHPESILSYHGPQLVLNCLKSIGLIENSDSLLKNN